MAQHTYQVSLNTSIGGQFASNIFHWAFDDAGFSTSAAAAAALCSAWLTRDLTHMRSMTPDGVTFLSMKSRRVGVPGGFEAVELIAAGTTGTRAGVMQAAGISACIIHYPINNGKIRGRTFWPGLSDDDANSGYLSETYKSDWAVQNGQIYDNLTLVGGGAPVATFVLYNRTTHLSTTSVEHKLSDLIAQVRRRQLPA